MPYPPNKGDKVRSFNILKHIAASHNVFLGTFVDDPEDHKYIPTIEKFCKLSYFEKINKRYSKLLSLRGLYKKNALTLNFYKSSKFQNWINKTVENNKIDVILIFSSVMAQFISKDLYSRTIIDFVDVDSKKWSEYAEKVNFPFSWIYRREGKYLFQYERYLALHSRHSFFVTEKERDLFSSQAPETNFKTSSIKNGVDSDFFLQNSNFLFPFALTIVQPITLVFTGAMDYHPNIDAVLWFVKDIFSILIKKYSTIRFYIVGRSPSKEVLNLSSESIFVTGTVEDVRPFLQYADVVVAPLRIARGIQNKILEAMAMAKPVVASAQCVSAIDTVDGVEILSANTALDFINNIDYLINNKNEAYLIGCAARNRIIESYSWNSHLKGMDKYLDVDSNEITL